MGVAAMEVIDFVGTARCVEHPAANDDLITITSQEAPNIRDTVVRLDNYRE